MEELYTDNKTLLTRASVLSFDSDNYSQHFPPFRGFMNTLEGAAGRGPLLQGLGHCLWLKPANQGGFSIILQTNHGPKSISLHRSCYRRLCNIGDPNCYNGSKHRLMTQMLNRICAAE